jgi:predicted dehydrogenase
MQMSRRSFMSGAAAVAAVPSVLGQAKRVYRFAVVGCGGRGNGAVKDFLAAVEQLGGEAKLVAAADFFVERAQKTLAAHGGDVKFAFGTANGYKKVLETDAEFILLCTPPFFRARQAEAAIAAGKHVFVEKPIATDPLTLRHFLSVAETAKQKGLMLLAGTQKRHNPAYQALMDSIAAGSLGTIVGAQVIRFNGSPKLHPRQPGDTNAAYLCRSWYSFWEMSGDFYTEQVIHEVDVMNWAIGRYPKSAMGTGGRWARPKGIGNIYDSFSMEYDYGENLFAQVTARQIPGVSNRVGVRITGTDARVFLPGMIKRYDGTSVNLADAEKRYWSRVSKVVTPQALEHFDGLKALQEGRVVNDGEQVALSTATCMIGTMAACDGGVVRMSDILSNEKSPFYNGWNARFRPEDFERDEDVPLPPEGVCRAPNVQPAYG